MVCIALLHPFVKVRKTFTNAFDRIRERKVDEGVKKMDVRKFGYIRMSSKDQNEGRQLQAMLDNVLKERDI
jgi:hypothetical protein